MRYSAVVILCFALSCSKATEPDRLPDTPCAPVPEGTTGMVRLSGIVPNPEGTDDYAEFFLIRNYSSVETVSLAGWSIHDDESNGTVKWDLAAHGSLAPCEEKVIISDKNAQLLNSGDTVHLYNPAGERVQTVLYDNTVKSGDTVRAR